MLMPLAIGQPRSKGAADDRAAFEGLLSPELDHAYQLAGYVLGTSADAEDAVYEAVLRAWQAFGGLRDRDRFGPWLTRIVVNVCRDRLRRRKVVSMVPIGGIERAGAGEPQSPDPFASALARDAVGRALAVLGPEQRAVVVLHYWGCRSVAEIAALLEVPAGTVKWRLHAACDRMRRELEADEEVSR